MSNLVAPAPLIRLLDLCKTFDAQRALDQVSLDIYPGEGVALLGATGAGKSTLVKILSGSLAPDAGELWVDGQRQRFTSPLSARRVGIVAVHQRPDDGIAPGLSVAENLLLDELGQPDADFLLNRKNLLQRAEAIAAGLGLDLPLQHPVERLGQADRQLLVLARAFAQQPRFLILDEPTAALSETDAERLLGLIDSQRARGVAILYISQRLSDLQRCHQPCDCVAGRTADQRPQYPAPAKCRVYLVRRCGRAAGSDTGQDPAGAVSGAIYPRWVHPQSGRGTGGAGAGRRVASGHGRGRCAAQKRDQSRELICRRGRTSIKLTRPVASRESRHV